MHELGVSVRLAGIVVGAGLAAACPSNPPADAKSSPPQAPASTPASAPATQASSEASSARGESPKDRDHVDPDGVVRRGDELSSAEAMTVAAVMQAAPELSGKSVKVTGTVGKVCSKAGCWFELKASPDAPGIRITSKGYRFFVPSNCSGMTATIEGDLKVQTLDVETAQHYADDAVAGTDEPAEQVAAPVREVSIAAVGLEMTKPASGS